MWKRNCYKLDKIFIFDRLYDISFTGTSCFSLKTGFGYRQVPFSQDTLLYYIYSFHYVAFFIPMFVMLYNWLCKRQRTVSSSPWCRYHYTNVFSKVLLSVSFVYGFKLRSTSIIYREAMPENFVIEHQFNFKNRRHHIFGYTISEK